MVLGIIAGGALLWLALHDHPALDRPGSLNVSEDQELQALGIAPAPPLDPDSCFSERHAELVVEMAGMSGNAAELECEDGRCCVIAYEPMATD